MEEKTNEERNIAGRFSSSAEGLSRGFENEDHPLEPEIVKPDHGIKAIRETVIVYPNKGISNIKNKRMERDESSREKRQQDSASFSFRANLPQNFSGIENCMVYEPLDLSKKSNPSTQKNYLNTSEELYESRKDDTRQHPRNSSESLGAEFSSPGENTARQSQNESKLSFHSCQLNNINESQESQHRIRSNAKLKRKMCEGTFIKTEAERFKTNNSASSRNTTEILALRTSEKQQETISDYNETDTYDSMSSRPSSSSSRPSSYDSSVIQNPSTSKDRVSSVICKVCNKGFPSLSQLQRHMRVHTGQKPFKCEFCYTTFRQKYDLRIHTNRVHTNERLPARIAESHFLSNANLHGILEDIQAKDLSTAKSVERRTFENRI